MNRASFLRSLLLAPFAARAVLRGVGSSTRPPSYLDSKLVSVPYRYYPLLPRSLPGPTSRPLVVWTDNPAWIYYDLCVANGWRPDQIDLDSVKRAAAYCDEMA